jgi:hypothetical protein
MNAAAESGDTTGKHRWRSILLVCGALSSLLYVLLDVVCTWSWDAYRFAGQTVSELSAIGAPTRPLWLAGGYVYALLLAAFGFGVWLAAGQRRPLRIAALLVMGMVANNVAWSFFPMHLRGSVATLTDTMHIVLTVVNAVLTFAAMSFAGAGLKGRFRVYSLVTMAALLVGGAVTSIDAPRLAQGLDTPWIGIAERINVYGYLLWIFVFAVALVRETGQREARFPGLAPATPLVSS